jgi:hypothetical protein
LAPEKIHHGGTEATEDTEKTVGVLSPGSSPVFSVASVPPW